MEPGEADIDGENGGSQIGGGRVESGPEAVEDSAQEPVEGQAAEDVEDVAIENPVVRAVRDPGQPTRAEIA